VALEGDGDRLARPDEQLDRRRGLLGERETADRDFLGPGGGDDEAPTGGGAKKA